MDGQLGEAKGAISKIMESSNSAERKIKQLTTRDEMQAMLRNEADVLYRKIASPPELTNLPAASQAYTRAVETIEKINATVRGRQKYLTLCPLYSGVAQPVTRSTSTDKAYFDRFDALILQCIASEGTERWNVRLLYNVTSMQRLEMVVKWLSLGTEGYEVKAICSPSAISQLSPMIIDEQDAFLATVNNVSYRVDAAIHLKGKDAVAFVKRFSDSLWESSVYNLRRDETGINGAEISRLREAVIKLQM